MAVRVENLERRFLFYGPGDVIIEPTVNMRVTGDDGDNEIIIRLTDAGGVEALVDGNVVETSDVPVTYLRVRGLDGNDTIHLEGIACTDGIQINAGAGDDLLFGTDTEAELELLYANTLKGGPGNDTVVGGGQSDWIMGGNGDDVLFGNGRADLISGGNGNDFISGGNVADAIYAGAGDDTIDGGGGADLMAGQDGDDRFEEREEDDFAFHTNPPRDFFENDSP